jgi:hypothetical protein
MGFGWLAKTPSLPSRSSVNSSSFLTNRVGFKQEGSEVREDRRGVESNRIGFSWLAKAPSLPSRSSVNYFPNSDD